MPPKRDPDSTQAQRIIQLFGLLLFTGRPYSLGDLAKTLNCSKQTVMRMVERIELSGEAMVESWLDGNRKWYRIRAPKSRPFASLSTDEIRHLVLCKDLVMHLLPESIKDEVSKSLSRTTMLLNDLEQRDMALASVCSGMPKGAIDYTDHEKTLEMLMAAAAEGRVLAVTYKAPDKEPRLHYFTPARIITHRDALYCEGLRMEEKVPREPLYDMVLAVHRIQKAEKTRFQCPVRTSPAPEGFGFMREEPFQVKVRFGSGAAAYVRERTWSRDQELEELEDGGLLLTFKARSRPEVISWVLSFGADARLLEPDDLRQSLAQEVRQLGEYYG